MILPDKSKIKIIYNSGEEKKLPATELIFSGNFMVVVDDTKKVGKLTVVALDSFRELIVI